MTFNEFKTSWEETILPNEPEYIRKGQSLMNYLARIWFDEYCRITSDKELDCYYVNSKIKNTLNHLEKVWKEK